MSNHLGDYFRTERKVKLLPLVQVARLVGYRNITKGVRKLRRFEQDGTIKDDLLVKLAEVLGVSWDIVLELGGEDRENRHRAWTEWVNEPVPMRLIVRLIAASFCEKRLPDEIRTPERAEAWACDFASKHRVRVCLVVNRRLSVWIGTNGSIEKRTEACPDEPNEPYMSVKGDKRKFLMDFHRQQETDIKERSRDHE